MILLLLPAASAKDLVVLSEDFDASSTLSYSGTTGWITGYSTDPWATLVGDGVYSVKDDADGTWGGNTPIDDHLVYTSGEWIDLSFATTLYLWGSDTSGVVFRYTDEFNFYLFFLTGDKMPATGTGGQTTGSGAYLYVIEDGVATELSHVSAVTWGHADQLLEVVAEGDTIEVWLDEDYDATLDSTEQLLTVTDSTHAGGTVGLYCYNNGGYTGSSCNFDDVVVTVPDRDDDDVADQDDSCPDDANADQADLDRDGLGDVCDPDQDGDGYDATVDCDDRQDGVNPGAPERCSSAGDDNCDGSTNEPDAIGCSGWFADVDADGFGDPTDALCLCVVEAPHTSADGQDCADADATVHPGADETCDGVDQDCDGGVDEDAIDRRTWYQDADADGHGDPATTALACEQPTAWVADGDDCDDLAPSVHPGADETCDAEDDDCDGRVDEEAIDAPVWYADADGDSFGDPEAPVHACAAPDGSVADDQDCDDTIAEIHPGAAEHCDGVDEDCDGAVDTPDPVDGLSWYVDADGDGHGDPDAPVVACEAPAGAAAAGDDCDDDNPDIHPGAAELVNARDDDCDGRRDEGFDSDGDGLADDVELDDTHTDPQDPDSDGGGEGDGTEVAGGRDPLDPLDDLIPDHDTDEVAARTGAFYGGACGAAPGVSLGALPLATLLVLRRRRR